MARAADRRQWNHTAAVLALMANAWLRKKGQRPAKAEEFHPYLRARRRGFALNKPMLSHLARALGAQGAPASPSPQP